MGETRRGRGRRKRREEKGDEGVGVEDCFFFFSSLLVFIFFFLVAQPTSDVISDKEKKRLKTKMAELLIKCPILNNDLCGFCIREQRDEACLNSGVLLSPGLL